MQRIHGLGLFNRKYLSRNFRVSPPVVHRITYDNSVYMQTDVAC